MSGEGTDARELTSAMNDTKWDELRLAMNALDPPPAFQITTNDGHTGPCDGEWFYHFRDGGYADILHVDILPEDENARAAIAKALATIYVPGVGIDIVFHVFGYLLPGQSAVYFQP